MVECKNFVLHGRKQHVPTSYPYCWALTLAITVTAKLPTVVLVAIEGSRKELYRGCSVDTAVVRACSTFNAHRGCFVLVEMAGSEAVELRSAAAINSRPYVYPPFCTCGNFFVGTRRGQLPRTKP